MNTVTTGNHTTAIGERVLRPAQGDLPPEVASTLLDWKFSEDDLNRADALAAEARAGTLTEDEKQELDSYLLLDAF
jgi:hypothetical protein